MKLCTLYFQKIRTGIYMSDRRRNYRLFKVLCFTLSAALLSTGYFLVGWWQIVLVFPVALLLWKIATSRPGISVPSVILGGYIFLASLGIWIGLEPCLMVYGSILALASWELQLFQAGLIGEPPHSNSGLLERSHLKSLSIVILLSFLVTTIGLNIHLRLPFGVVLFLVLLVGILLERVYFYLIRGTT